MQPTNFVKKPIFTGVGIVVIIIAIMTSSYYMTKKNINLAYNTIKIAQLENNAFGSLQSNQSEEPVNIQNLAGVGSGGGGGELTSSIAGINGGGGMPVSFGERTDLKMRAPEWINYTYVYKGDDLEITETEMEVLKRTKDKASSQEFVRYISKINLDSLDLGKFQNTEITNLQINENRKFGYSLYLDFIDNNISINANWEQWPTPSIECRGLAQEESQKCFDANRLKLADVPADEILISIANQFLKDYEIDMSMYGKPEILDYWRNNYDTDSEAPIYISEAISVIYPLVINNQVIYDESGNKTGLTVQINIKNNKVAGLNGLTSQSYASSNYEVENDSQTIIALAEKGGLRRIYNYQEASKTVEVKLGTPTLGLIKYYQPSLDKKETAELLIPAYIFPVINSPETGAYNYVKNIVVPLVKEIITERISGDDDGLILVPLIEPAMPVIIVDEEEPMMEVEETE